MINHLPKELIEAAQTQINTSLYESIMLVEDRISFLKEKNPVIDTSHDKKAASWDTTADQIIDHLADKADPTKKKVHTQWLLGQYKKKNIRLEDSPRIKDALSNFEKYKGKLEKKDINQYKNIGEVEDSVHPHIGTAATKAEEKNTTNVKGRTLVHDNGNGVQVYRLEQNEDGRKASQEIYGGGHESGGTHTSWCTAARSQHCMFDHYSKDQALHVIHTPDGSVYQAHPNTGQLMDARDNTVKGTQYGYNDEEIKHKNGEHISAGLDHIPDGHILKIAHDLPNVHHTDITKVLDNDNIIDDHVLKKAAEHPSASQEDIMRAANHPSGNVRESAMYNPNASMAVIEHGLKDKASVVRTAAASHPNLSGDQLEKIYHENSGTNEWSVLRRVLSHDNVPQHILRQAIEHSDFMGAKYAVNNPKADGYTLEFAANNSHRLQDNIADHPNTRPETLHKLLNNEGFRNQYTAAKAAANPNASAENLHKALDHSEGMVRGAALSNPNATADHLSRGMSDTEHNNAYRAVSHPNATPEHIEMGLNHESTTVRGAAAANPNISKEQLDHAVNHDDFAIRGGAARNKNLTHEQMDKLSQDPHQLVKTSLNKNMEYIAKELGI